MPSNSRALSARSLHVFGDLILYLILFLVFVLCIRLFLKRCKKDMAMLRNLTSDQRIVPAQLIEPHIQINEPQIIIANVQPVVPRLPSMDE